MVTKMNYIVNNLKEDLHRSTYPLDSMFDNMLQILLEPMIFYQDLTNLLERKFDSRESS